MTLAHLVQVAILVGVIGGLAVVGVGTAVVDYCNKTAAANAADLDEWVDEPDDDPGADWDRARDQWVDERIERGAA